VVSAEEVRAHASRFSSVLPCFAPLIPRSFIVAQIGGCLVDYLIGFARRGLRTNACGSCCDCFQGSKQSLSKPVYKLQPAERMVQFGVNVYVLL
jgi:hypothetical protein